MLQTNFIGESSYRNYIIPMVIMLKSHIMEKIKDMELIAILKLTEVKVLFGEGNQVILKIV